VFGTQLSIVILECSEILGLDNLAGFFAGVSTDWIKETLVYLR